MSSRRPTKKQPVNHNQIPADQLQVNAYPVPFQMSQAERAERRRLEQLTGWTHCLVLPGGRTKENAPVIVANYQMQLGSPLVVVACNNACVLTLPKCAPGETLEVIPTYSWSLTGQEPSVQPMAGDVWLIDQTTGESGVFFQRELPPYLTQLYQALPTASGCEWQNN